MHCNHMQSRLTFASDVGVAALRATIADTLQIPLARLRTILPDGMFLREDNANASLAVSADKNE